MAVIPAKTNPNQYSKQDWLAASTTTNDAIDLGFNAQYLRVESASSAEVYLKFGSTAATTQDDYPLSTGEVITLQTGPLTRDIAIAHGSASTQLGGIKVLGLGG